MATGLQLILIVGLLLNILLGFTLAWFLVDKLSQSDRRTLIRTRFGRTAIFLGSGILATAITYALSIVIIWPPHVF